MDAVDSRAEELAALGRPFKLGMLYDCRRDLLIPGLTLWDHDALQKNISERSQFYNDFEIIASESISDKSSSLGVEASVKASFLSGLIQVEGSAKYLNDNKTSKKQARVTLKYKTTTKVKELTMNQLGRGNVKHPYIFDQGLATHVVTAILYGAQAFFVFDREVSDTENYQDIQGNLQVMIKKIPALSIEGEGALKMEDEDKENVDKFSCRFHGDFCLEQTPVSFLDAVKVYQDLPRLLGPDGGNAVPVRVWLLPLTTLDSAAAKLVRQISVRLVQEAQCVLEDLGDLEMRCNDALKQPVARQFPQIQQKIKTFNALCNEFKLGFQASLARKLIAIRGAGEDEAELAEILRSTARSPFNSRSLGEWIDCRERELSTIRSLTNMMKNTKVISSQGALYEETLSVDRALCLVFTTLGCAEPFLITLESYLKSEATPLARDTEEERWYSSKELCNTVRTKVKLFSDFAESNKDNENLSFLAVGLPDQNHKALAVHLYENGFLVDDNFEPPSKPVVSVVNIKHNCVILGIAYPKSSGSAAFSVEYCVSGDKGWHRQPECRAGQVSVNGLSPDTEHSFRVRAVCTVGVGPAVHVTAKTTPQPSLRSKSVRILTFSVEYD